MVDGFTFHQVSNFSGSSIITICAQGARLENEKNGLVMITHPKSTLVTVMNLASKLYCVVPIATWTPPFFGGNIIRGGQFTDLRLVSTEPTKEHGLDSDKCTFKTVKNFDNLPKGHTESLTVVETEITATRALPCDKPTWKLASVLFGIPETTGYPLAETYVNRKKKEHVDLRLAGFDRGKVDAGKMAPPADFKKAATLAEIYASAGGAQGYKDILEGF